MYEADFDKPGIYGSGRVWANAWDVSRRAPSRGGRGRRAAVVSWCVLGWGGIFRVVFFSIFFFFSNVYGLLQVWGRLASFTYLLAMKPFFACRQKKILIPGCLQHAII